MPLYDLRCPDGCGVFEDVVCSVEERLTQACPECGATLRTVPPIVRTVGPMPSNPLEIKQIGRRFESNAELRQYQRENNVELHDSNSSTWRGMKDSVREKCEKTAKRQGFRDYDHKQAVSREAAKTGKSIHDH